MKFIYNYLIVICIFLLPIKGDENKENCIVYKDDKELSDAEWENGIKLGEVKDTTEIGAHLFKYKTKNVRYVYIDGNQNYINIDKDRNDDLIIKTGASFDRYEDRETALEITVKVRFSCGNYPNQNERYLKITIPIKDTNNHDPTFLNTPYNFKLPMPLPKGFTFDPVIIGKDVDLTNKEIKFEFDKKVPGFGIKSSGRNEKDKKTHLAIFTTTDTIDLEKDISLVLHATDSGVPPRNTSTTITISIDKANSHPRFSNQIYIANLTNLDYKKVNNTKLQFLGNKNVTLDRGFRESVKFEIKETSDENKKNFKLTHSGSLGSSGIDTYVELVNVNEKFLLQKEISVVLAAINHQSEGQTVLHVILPRVPVDANVSPVICDKQSDEESSSSGYMVATIMLSLVIVGLLVYIGYLVLYKNIR